MVNPYEPPTSNPKRPPGYGMEAATPVAKLAWYEQVWAGLPLVLVIVGGAVGGACGGLAWAINQKVFRAVRQPVLRYLATGFVSVLAVLLYIVVVRIVITLMRG